MQRLMKGLFSLALPATLVTLLAVGCGGGGDNKPTGGGDNKPKTEGTKDGKSGTKKDAPTPVEVKATGTFKGKVKFKGTPPNLAEANSKLQVLLKEKDAATCHADDAPAEEKEQQEWRIAKDGGVANVFVWLMAPEGKFFPYDDKSPPKDVVIDQPHCAYLPHAMVLFPEYRDPQNPTKMKRTGQKVIVKNSSKALHNTSWKGAGSEDNKSIAPGGQLPIDNFEAPANMKEVIEFKCSVHSYMKAVARSFNHPYATVTDKDGNFEIKNVPADVELSVVVWHEVAGFTNGDRGEKMTFKAGDNTKDFEVQAK